MTREQRRESQTRSSLRRETDKFFATPCSLPEQHVRALLGELCSELGICLSPDDHESIVANPPTNPHAFAKRVVGLDGGSTSDPDEFMPVLERVLRTFQGVAGDGK